MQLDAPLHPSPTYTQNVCQAIHYIDCRNWMDFTQQIIIFCLAFALFLRASYHYRNLIKQKQDEGVSEHQRSVRRKIRVNLVQLVYLGCFMLSTLYNLYLFMPYHNDYGFFQSKIPQNIYKFTQILFINWLNALNLTVGLLYWKAARAYYVLSDLQIPIYFRRVIKYIFFTFFIFNGLAIIISGVFLFDLELNKDHEYIFKQVTLLVTIISISACIIPRILFRRHILSKIQLSRKAITREWVMSIALFFSSLTRIVLYTLDIFTYDQSYEWQDDVRREELVEDGTGCIDRYYFYWIFLLGVNLIVNLLPAAIYGYLFVSEVETNKLNRSNKLLKKNSQDWQN